jgi:hypothetical protein
MVHGRRYGLLLGAALLVLFGAAPLGAAVHSPATVASAHAHAVDRHVSADPAQLQVVGRAATSVPHLPVPDATPASAAALAHLPGRTVDASDGGRPSSISTVAGRPRAPPPGDLH